MKCGVVFHLWLSPVFWCSSLLRVCVSSTKTLFSSGSRSLRRSRFGQQQKPFLLCSCFIYWLNWKGSACLQKTHEDAMMLINCRSWEEGPFEVGIAAECKCMDPGAGFERVWLEVWWFDLWKWGVNDSKELGNDCAFIIMLPNTKYFE